MPGVIVIGYDGSGPARHAIDVAAQVVRAAEAIVVNVWSPTVPMTMPSAGPPPPAVGDPALEAAAWKIADEGVRRAADAGFAARPEIRCGAVADVGGLLAAIADERDADLVLVGRRGVSRIEAAVFGSVSQDTVRASHRPVLVVTSHSD
jgi:nucleotide-binding universal stress UspA family protein